jgi:ribosomal protein L37E
MHYKRCSVCGVPKIVSRMNRWMPNGTIVSRGDPRIRQVFYEAEMLPELRRRISEGLGFPVNRIFYEAERNSVRIVIAALLQSAAIRTTLRIPPFKHGAVRFFNNMAWMTGTASSRTVEYHGGKYGVARMRNPWDLDLMAAVVVGAFEALEGKPLRSFWKKEDGEYLLRVEVTEKKPELSARLEVEFSELKGGDYRHHRCPRCGIPLDIRHMEWQEDEGLIVDKRRGIRMLNWEGLTLSLVTRELIRELGDEVIPIIVDAERDYTMKMLEDLGLTRPSEETRSDLLQEMLSLLPLYGLGLATDVEYTSGGVLRVWVDNTYSEHFMAGRLAAFYEAMESKRARVEWSQTGPSSVSYILAPEEE